VAFKNRTKEAWADIDVQLKRRHDLIPNLMEAVKGYAAHEKQVLENVTAARSAAMDAKTPEEKLKRKRVVANFENLFAVAEITPI